jgi:glycosyltransferase involved in cell wall biosynthesis
MHSARPDVARVYASIRTVYLERFQHMRPADVYYQRTRYDFDASLGTGGSTLHRMSPTRVLVRLARHWYRVVEVNEPQMNSRWIAVAAQIVVIRLRSLVTRRRTAIVTYAMENADPAAKLTERWHVPPWLSKRVTKLIVSTLVRNVDRIAFATAGARDAYARYAPRVMSAPLFEAVPAPCTCLPSGNGGARAPQVAFVGVFSERKGIRQLLAAWDSIARQRPSWRLTVVGKGPLTDDVVAWAEGRADVSVEIDPPRRRIHEVYREAAVLFLPSQPVGAWREQIGLPVLEGLAHGCTVVTTEQGGLATWLSAHGHGVVQHGAAPDAFAACVIRAVEARRAARDVVADLPRQDNRIVADEWLMTGEIPGAVSDASRPRDHRGRAQV